MVGINGELGVWRDRSQIEPCQRVVRIQILSRVGEVVGVVFIRELLEEAEPQSGFPGTGTVHPIGAEIYRRSTVNAQPRMQQPFRSQLFAKIQPLAPLD